MIVKKMEEWFKIDYRIFNKFWNWKRLKHKQRNCYETVVSAFTIKVMLVVTIILESSSRSVSYFNINIHWRKK